MCEFIISTCVSDAAGNQAEEDNCSALESCGSINLTEFVPPSSTSSDTTSTTSSSSGTGSTDSTTPSAGAFPQLTVPPIAASSSSSVSVPSSSSASPNPTGLSTGAKVGIRNCYGTVGGVVGRVLGGYFLGRRGKEDLNAHPGMAELSHNGIHEIPQLETKERPGELEGRGLPDERVHEIG
jgi:hypothetical protein